ETIQPPQIPVAGALRRSPATMRRQRQVPVHGAEVSDQRSSGLLRRGAARHIRVKLDPDLVMVRLTVPRMPGATVGIDNAPDRVLRNDVMGTGPGALVAQPRHDALRVLPRRATPPVASNPGNLPVPCVLIRGSVFGNVLVGSSHNG